MDILIEENPLDKKYKNHSLVGNYYNRMEYHIEPDWLLIYKINSESIIFSVNYLKKCNATKMASTAIIILKPMESLLSTASILSDKASIAESVLSDRAFIAESVFSEEDLN